jgi:hypothetical protein
MAPHAVDYLKTNHFDAVKFDTIPASDGAATTSAA